MESLVYCCRLGKVVIPEKTSASFVSFTGNYDLRTELDRNIKHGDPRYYAELSMMASKASYENKEYLETIVNHQWEVQYCCNYVTVY